jgi:transposase
VHDFPYLPRGGEMNESYFGWRRKRNQSRRAVGKILVFHILEQEWKVPVEVIQDVTGETLLTRTSNKGKQGSLVYTE